MSMKLAVFSALAYTGNKNEELAMMIICPYCKKELTLFQSQVERRRGRIRCVGCSAVIPYDLDRGQRRRRTLPGLPPLAPRDPDQRK